jgi:hypothetical protein
VNHALLFNEYKFKQTHEGEVKTQWKIGGQIDVMILCVSNTHELVCSQDANRNGNAAKFAQRLHLLLNFREDRLVAELANT